MTERNEELSERNEELSERNEELSERSRRQLVLNQYKGKEELLSLYVKLLNEISKLGEDIEISPKEERVVLRTKKEFVFIIPVSHSQMTIGLNIVNLDSSGKLLTSEDENEQYTHKIELSGIPELDQEVMMYIQKAYEYSKS